MSFHENIQARPFAFDRTFTLPVREAARQYRRKTDASELAHDVETLRRQIERLEQGHAEELARTRSEAFEAGRNHAAADREAAILCALDAMQASLEEIWEQHDEMRVQAEADATEVALVAAEALAGRAIAREPGGAVDEAIGRALAQVGRGQEIEVTVHPDLVDDIEARIALRQCRDRRKLCLVVSADPSLRPGDAVLNWERGGVRMDAASRRQAVLDELAPLLASQN
ncbi:FliH/SctL family protein [Alteriqipengyuania lutimaris]|uniref:Flagellar assembly protein FliH n=1 Tax=Alteriqipengyuania lutimaris TaxID=1538146 RepID=A0A395LSG1_9SPHN|nr:FliH/SctL family protein [Alteriqipengyuania lutimaris]MBB3032478.1 flagellar assembly protein FliH [Alteriqipengyuania lutimaris]RDS78384.1 flagellar assembly protein FliH [Alteriqipengyuania lutimaris]